VRVRVRVFVVCGRLRPSLSACLCACVRVVSVQKYNAFVVLVTLCFTQQCSRLL